MKVGIAVALLMGAISLNAQTAKVIALSPEDAARTKDLYAQRDAINKKIEDNQQRIINKYLMEPKPGSGSLTVLSGSGLLFCSSSGCSPETAEEKSKREADYKAYLEAEKKKTHLERKTGWPDIEYSDDFKFIVPKNNFTTTAPVTNCGWLGNSCLIAN